MQEFIDKFKIPIGLSLVGIVLIIGGMFASGIGNPSTRSARSGQEFPKESLVSNQNISVDVSGAVLKPGVYQVEAQSRVEDAITAAGGFSDKANAQYISKSLNMAQKMSDGMKIYVPFEGEQTGGVSGGSAVAGVKTSGKVNINTASQSDLEALPGIGSVTAAKIISGRPYQKIDDLLDQKIVSKSVFEKIKDSLSLY